MNAFTPSPSASYRQISTGAFQRRAPSSGMWFFCPKDEALSALASASAPSLASPLASPSPEILSLASEVREDLAQGYVKRIYPIPGGRIALVFSQSGSNGKIKPAHYAGTFTQLTIAPIAMSRDVVEKSGVTAAAELLGCDRSCYFLSRGALKELGRELPEGRKGLRATDPGFACYVNWNTISAAKKGAEKGKNKRLYLSRRNLWRLTTWGDLSVLPVQILKALFGGIEARGEDSVLAYTNAWRPSSSASPEAREYLRGRAQASVSDAGEALEAIRSGWSAFFPDESSLSLAPSLRAEGLKVKPCTATPQTKHGCSDCLLCDGSAAALITAHKH